MPLIFFGKYFGPPIFLHREYIHIMTCFGQIRQLTTRLGYIKKWKNEKGMHLLTPSVRRNFPMKLTNNNLGPLINRIAHRHGPSSEHQHVETHLFPSITFASQLHRIIVSYSGDFFLLHLKFFWAFSYFVVILLWIEPLDGTIVLDHG